MKQLFETKRLIHFNEADPQGILFYAKVFDFAHNALESFLASQEIGWAYWFQNPEFAVPIKASAAIYQAPISVGQSYLEKLHLKKCGNSSVTFIYEIYTDKDAPLLCAQVETTHVFVNRKSFDTILIPDRLKKILDV